MLLIICVMIGIIVAGDMILGVLINTFVEVIYQKYDIEQLSKMKKVESIYQNKADVFGADFTKILIDTYMNHEGRSYEDTMLEVIHRPLNPWIISFLIATYKGKHLVSSSEEAGWLSTSYEDPRKSIRGIKVKVNEKIFFWRRNMLSWISFGVGSFLANWLLVPLFSKKWNHKDGFFTGICTFVLAVFVGGTIYYV